MTISVIIPTYRRVNELERCLKALKSQLRGPDEIVVVARDSDEETQNFLKYIKTDYPKMEVAKVIAPGQVAALNAGLDTAKGDIIVFTDDDTVAHFDWLKRIEEHFRADPKVGGVGGRDWCYINDQLLDGRTFVVGKLFWFGLIISNHHLGGGKARLVDHLKGANMSFRREALKRIRFDERLHGKGSQPRNDLATSLAVKRAGWKLIYDPQVSIDHYISKRHDEKERGRLDVYTVSNMAFNETLVLLEHFSPIKRIVFILWVLLVGNQGTPGVALCIRALLRGKKEYWPAFFVTLRNRYEAWKEYLLHRKRENTHQHGQTVSASSRPYRLAYLVSHVIQYHTQLYRTLAANDKIDLTVYFCSDWGAREYIEREYGIKIKWDRQLLDGYKYRILRNWSPKPDISYFFGMINPGIIPELLRCRYDAVIIHGYHLASCWLGYIGARLSRTPVLLKGEFALRPHQQWWARTIKKISLPILFKGTTAFLSPGSKTDEFLRYFGIDSDRIFFTPLAVDNDFFMRESQKWESEKSRLKTALGIPDELLVILFVGKLIQRKRPFDLLCAYESVKDKAALLFVGEGALRQELEKYTTDRELSKVFFMGFKNQSELPRYYAMADIFVLPSSKEVCPLVINEAMCSRLPLVASDAIPFAEDFIDEGKNGYIFPCGNIERLKSILSTVLENRELRNSMGLCSQERIKKWNNMQAVESILKALDKSCEKRI